MGTVTPTETLCATCLAYGDHTPATTTAPAYLGDGYRAAESDEDEPSCESCRAIAMAYPVRADWIAPESTSTRIRIDRSFY